MKRLLSAFMCFLMIFGCSTAVMAESRIDKVISDTAEYLCESVSSPEFGSTGGEWLILGLARSGFAVPEGYYAEYYKRIEEYTAKQNGVLHEKKHTEYSRVILALTSIGKDPSDVAGYNLLMPLGDLEKTKWQGINGSIWALIALDSKGYSIPECPSARVQATREMYVSTILEAQTSDGGWALSGDTADADITAMALLALSGYRSNTDVEKAVGKALECLSAMQTENAGFKSRGVENCESCAQVLTAICELGIPYNDARFVKNGKTLLDNLLSFYVEGKGFRHSASSFDINQMSTEQAFYSIIAVKRALKGDTALYDMSDITSAGWDNALYGLPGRNADVRRVSIVNPGKSFSDVAGHKSSKAILALAERGIINGRSEDIFDPEATVTRAEFAAIAVRSLGLAEKASAVFDDVTPASWFYGSVGTAYSYGIVNGVSKTQFNPGGTITRQEAAVMTARAARLCGSSTDIATFEARNILAGFTDYVKASEWAVSSLAFCYGNGILDGSAMEIKPKEAVTRAEVAQMLYNMLELSGLI